jgi:hypothetical protein
MAFYCPTADPAAVLRVEVCSEGDAPVLLDLDMKSVGWDGVCLSRDAARKVAMAILKGLEAGSCAPVEIKGES